MKDLSDNYCDALADDLETAMEAARRRGVAA